MKNKMYVLAAALMLMATASKAMADDVDCDEDKVKTCFMDGGETTSCICVDPAENRDDPVLPENEDSPNPSQYEPPE